MTADDFLIAELLSVIVSCQGPNCATSTVSTSPSHLDFDDVAKCARDYRGYQVPGTRYLVLVPGSSIIHIPFKKSLSMKS